MDLRDKFGGGGNLLANCIRPEHRDDSASMVIYANGVHCFGCNEHWTPEMFLYALGGRELTTTRSYTRSAPYIQPTLAQAETFSDWLLCGPYQDRLQAMHARGLRVDILRKNLIGHTGEAFCIPVFRDTELVSLRYRRDEACNPDRPKYWGTRGLNGVLVYQPECVGPRSPSLYICEGELDALRLAQEGRWAVSLTNGAGAAKSAPEVAEVFPAGVFKVVMYDQDDAGQKGAEQLLRRLPGKTVVCRWPEALGKDVTDFLLRWPMEELDRYVRNAWL